MALICSGGDAQTRWGQMQPLSLGCHLPAWAVEHLQHLCPAQLCFSLQMGSITRQTCGVLRVP